jgi:hypothetical protein
LFLPPTAFSATSFTCEIVPRTKGDEQANKEGQSEAEAIIHKGIRYLSSEIATCAMLAFSQNEAPMPTTKSLVIGVTTEWFPP